ncbi:MAG: hypothetical protein IJ317_03660 [Clostridia bacterium]|nr:hypothetical protein [Clostridia bacterium]
MHKFSKTYQLTTAIVAFIFPLFIFIYEILAFDAYVERPDVNGAVAFGIIVIVALALFFSLFIVASGILKLVSAIGLRRAGYSAPQRRFRIVGIVGCFICAAALVCFGIVFLLAYSGGYFSKALYFLWAGGEITVAVLECKRAKSF